MDQEISMNSLSWNEFTAGIRNSDLFEPQGIGFSSF
jgi:hypothetical protein